MSASNRPIDKIKYLYILKFAAKVAALAALYAGIWYLITKILIRLGVFPFPEELTATVLENTGYSYSVKLFIFRLIWVIQFIAPVFLASLPVGFINIYAEQKSPYLVNVLVSLFCFIGLLFALLPTIPNYMPAILTYFLMLFCFIAAGAASLFLMRRFISRRRYEKQMYKMARKDMLRNRR
jgi:hypothetical protein